MGGPGLRQFGAGGLDVGAGVADRFGGVHGGSGGDEVVERFGVEGLSDVIDRRRHRSRSRGCLQLTW